ncbi:MAG: hypothetical protein WC690_01420 [bacterium]
MKISGETCHKLLQLLGRISWQSGSDEVLPDVKCVALALRVDEDGSATLRERDSVLAAVHRLIDGQPDFSDVTQAIEAARKASIRVHWDQMAKDLYARSPILQEIDISTLYTPEDLISHLETLRPQIQEEQRAISGKKSSYALSTLVAAFAAGGARLQDPHRLMRMATAREFFERSDILKGADVNGFTSPAAILAWLSDARSAIDEEQRKLGIKREGDVPYALSTLVQALHAGGKINGMHARCMRQSTALELYRRSPLLQSINGENLATPHKALAILRSILPQVETEQRDARQKKTPINYRLSTLLGALIAAGRIREKTSDYLRTTIGWNLFENSPILQGLSEEECTDPQSLAAKLSELRNEIIRERQRRRGKDEDEPDYCTISSLMTALAAGGKIRGALQQFNRMASARELYDCSGILKAIPDQILARPAKLIVELARIRPEIEETQGLLALSGGDKPRSYSLATLIDALHAGGRIRTHLEGVKRLAAARDLYDRSELLKDISDDAISTPLFAVETLASLRSHNEISGYSLGTLMRALVGAGRIRGNTQQFERTASARELYDRSDILRSMSDEDFASPKALIQKLAGLRGSIVREQQAVRGDAADGLDHYSLGTLLLALVAGGRLTGPTQRYERMASAREFYDRSLILKEIGDAYLSSPAALIAKLIQLRPAIAEEQQRLRGNGHGTRNAPYALTTLIDALDAGDRLRASTSDYLRAAGGCDIFLRSPALQRIPKEILDDDLALMKFLIARRDRIAVENLRSRGKLSADQFTFPGAENHYSIGTLVTALESAGRINHKRTLSLRGLYICGLDYFLRRRDEIEPEVRRVIATKKQRGFMKVVDRSKFIHMKDVDSKSSGEPLEQLANSTIYVVLRMGRWILTDPTISLRSIFSADELAFCALFPHFFTGDLVRRDIVNRLEDAGSRAEEDPIVARRDAAQALTEILDQYEGREVNADTTGEYLKNIGRLVEWNQDALECAAAAPDEAGAIDPDLMPQMASFPLFQPILKS